MILFKIFWRLQPKKYFSKNIFLGLWAHLNTEGAKNLFDLDCLYILSKLVCEISKLVCSIRLCLSLTSELNYCRSNYLTTIFRICELNKCTNIDVITNIISISMKIIRSPSVNKRSIQHVCAQTLNLPMTKGYYINYIFYRYVQSLMPYTRLLKKAMGRWCVFHNAPW